MYGWGQDSCRLAPFIATHWDSIYNRESPGSGDADTRYLLYPKDGYPWDPGKLPAYDDYNSARTASTAVNIHRTRDDSGFNMLDTVRLAPGGNGIADAIDRYALDFFRIIIRDPANYDRRTYLDILNYGPYQNQDYYLDTASRNVQILNNVYLYDQANGVKGLATITLPPHWRKSRRYPVYLHGNGYGIPDNNAQYGGYGRSLLDARMAAYFTKNSVDSGIITVYVNNGGKESSGANQALIANLENFMRHTLPAYGGDTGRVVIAGASRGGLEAAQWGVSNAFTAQTILSAVPPIKLGSMAGLSLSTFPQLNVINLPLGSPTAWKRDYASAGNPTGVLGPYKKAQAVCQVLLGDTSLARADSLSLFGIYQRADTARLNRKFIHFSYGARDAYFPLGYFLQFDSLLTARGIRHSSHIGYGFGHNIGVWPEYWNSEMARIAQGRAPGPYPGKTRRFLIPKHLLPGTDPVGDTNSAIILSPAWIDTICRYRPGYLSGGKAHSPDSLGFSAVIPYGILKDSSFEIAVTGQWKAPWRIWARYEKGYQEVFSAWGGFGDSIKTSQDGSNPAIGKEGGREFAIIRNLKLSVLDTLEWFFRYDGREIPNRFTPYAHPATGAFQRALSVASATEPATAMPYQRGFSRPSVCNGADQFHPLLLKANDAAEFLPFGDTTIQLSRQNPIVLRIADRLAPGSDSDAKDTLRYDLLDAAGKYIPNGIMDRKRGEFRLPTAAVAPGGPYTLMAMVSDGKGGSDTAWFRVTLSP